MSTSHPAQIDPERLREAARQRVQRLLAGRLRRGGVSTSRPEWFFQGEADPPQAYPGGWQVRVRTWRHWSDAAVHLDADNGELLYRCVDRLSDPPTSAEMTREEAEQAAASLVEIPRNARLASFRHEPFAPERKMVRLEWEHVHDGVRVEGDYLRVVIHPETHRLVSVARKWRPVRL